MEKATNRSVTFSEETIKQEELFNQQKPVGYDMSRGDKYLLGMQLINALLSGDIRFKDRKIERQYALKSPLITFKRGQEAYADESASSI